MLALKAALLVVWAVTSFACCYFARDLQFMVGPWPFDFWMAAQGAVLIFIGIIVLYAVVMKRLSPDDSQPTPRGTTDV